MKLSNMEIQNKINDKNLPFIIIEYNGYNKKSLFKHTSCKNEFYIRIDHLLKRSKCPNCDSKKRNIVKFQEESNKVHNNEYEILEFISGNKDVKIKHRVCENQFHQLGHRHLRGDRCPFCYRNFKLTKEEILKLSNDRWPNDEYMILSEDVEYSKKSLIKHKCGYEYSQLISSHINGKKCPKCSGNAPHTKESVQQKSDIIHNKEYLIIDEPKGSFSKIRIIHKSCGSEFYQVVSDHLSGCGCTKCNSSKGENLIERILIENNIKYIKEKKFENCRYKRALKFDFYIPNENTCIEYDGIQHFYPIRYFGGKKSFELQKTKDSIKKDFCLNEGIKLIRIKYDMTNDEIFEIINRLFCLQTFEKSQKNKEKN